MSWRYHTFKANLDRIEELNNRSTSARFGINKFADLSPQEFKQKYLMKNPITTPRNIDVNNVLKPKNIEAPNVFDWRDNGAVTPVKDQGQCGSCWAFSVTENVESMWILSKKSDNKTLRLSEQQVVDCDTSDGGCDGGDTPTAYEYIIGAGGLESESDYPYNAFDGHCKFDTKKITTKISQWKYATTAKDENTLIQNLVSWGPASICVDAEYWQYYSGGVLTAWECAWINQLDHCVQLVGYNKNAKAPYWIVRNSWSTEWGVDGYIYLSMNENTCGMTEEATTSVV
jgi:cathepsin F